MRTRARLTMVILGVLALCAEVRAAEGGSVEGTGEAQVRGGDVVSAKKEATADALKKCVEKVVGIQIESNFSSEQREVVQGNKDQFYSAVRDSLTQKAEGFVDSYDVIKEDQKGDVLRITVRAKIFESKVKAKAQELADMIAKAGHPKLMLVIQEVYIDTTGHKRVAKESSVAAYLEKELLERGFELRGARAAKDVADDSIATYDRWLDDAGGAAKMARDQGADILLAGRVEILDKGKIEDTGGLDALKGQTKIEISSVVRGLNASTGEVFSTKPVHMPSMGTDQERALMRALKGRGNNVIKQTFEQLLEDLKRSLMKTAEQGQSYMVSLKGVTSFRKLGAPFLEAVQALGGVSRAKQQSFESGVLTLDVAFKGSASELQQLIFSALEKTEGFKNLDIEGVSGKQLSFKL
jgi:hypothetical protein